MRPSCGLWRTQPPCWALCLAPDCNGNALASLVSLILAMNFGELSSLGLRTFPSLPTLWYSEWLLNAIKCSFCTYYQDGVDSSLINSCCAISEFYSVKQDHYFFFKGHCLLESGKSTWRLGCIHNVLFFKESKCDKMPPYVKPKWWLHGCW